jgi:hypothetical protein
VHEMPADIPRVADIIRRNGYRGYVPIETLGNGRERERIKTMLQRVRNATFRPQAKKGTIILFFSNVEARSNDGTDDDRATIRTMPPVLILIYLLDLNSLAISPAMSANASSRERPSHS